MTKKFFFSKSGVASVHIWSNTTLETLSSSLRRHSWIWHWM